MRKDASRTRKLEKTVFLSYYSISSKFLLKKYQNLLFRSKELIFLRKDASRTRKLEKTRNNPFFSLALYFPAFQLLGNNLGNATRPLTLPKTLSIQTVR